MKHVSQAIAGVGICAIGALLVLHGYESGGAWTIVFGIIGALRT